MLGYDHLAFINLKIEKGKTEETTKIDIGSRRGLFAKDTGMVLDHLHTGAPLYVSPNESLYALKVADAARRSAQTKETIVM